MTWLSVWHLRTQQRCWGGSCRWEQLPSGMWSLRVLPAGLGRSQQCRRVQVTEGEGQGCCKAGESSPERAFSFQGNVLFQS